MTELSKEECRRRMGRLTNRERHVLQQLALGNSRRVISGVLGLSVRTVDTYCRSLYAKLQVNSVAQAVNIELRAKL